MSFGKAPPATPAPPPPPNPPMYGSEAGKKKGGMFQAQPTFLGGALTAPSGGGGQPSLLGQ